MFIDDLWSLKVGPDFSRLKLSKMQLEVLSGQYRLNPAIDAVWDEVISS